MGSKVVNFRIISLTLVRAAVINVSMHTCEEL